jgi:hypothetical protein
MKVVSILLGVVVLLAKLGFIALVSYSIGVVLALTARCVGLL